MRFAADIHIHSRFSRATSRDLNLLSLFSWAQRKGLTVVGTGDFTHPAWRAELTEQLAPAEQGLFKLKEEFTRSDQAHIPPSCNNTVRFVLQVEISTIYKAGDKTRKVHHVILSPTLDGAEKLSSELALVGNVTSDGRPILGLDSRDLLEMVLEHCPGGCLIPAHIWTPWFSVLGSKSGFDTIEDCYRDLSDNIFAVETGLSSDPPMNWRLEKLDRYALVSNSDAHSAPKLGRECNLFDTDLSYDAMIGALKSKDPKKFLGTIEFFPEEGKYHFDGHRKCQVRLTPKETIEAGGICPECGKPVTVGVMNRVEELADRPEGTQPQNVPGFESLIGLAEILGHVYDCGPNTKRVETTHEKLLSTLGPELSIIQKTEIEDIEKAAGDLVAEAVRRVRQGKVTWKAGYDGEYGTFDILSPAEKSSSTKQESLFDLGPEIQPAQKKKPQTKKSKPPEPDQFLDAQPPVKIVQHVQKSDFAEQDENIDALIRGLGQEQHLAVVEEGGNIPILVIAGPGTGKTRTLTTRIAHRIRNKMLDPTRVLALTFTNRAAEEMSERLVKLLGSEADGLTVSTFHSWGLAVLRGASLDRPKIIDDKERIQLVKKALDQTGNPTKVTITNKVAQAISFEKSGKALSPPPGMDTHQIDVISHAYEKILEEENVFDFDDLVLHAARAFEKKKPGLPPRPQAVFVDEYQDLNPTQVRLLKAVIGMKDCKLFAIGDPDQAIYAFRGADPKHILEFEHEWPGAKVLALGRSYRSSEIILRAASQVIESAEGINRPRLWSGIEGEPHLLVMPCQDEHSEAERIALFIEQLLGGTSWLSFDSNLVDGNERELSLSFDDIAVLFRTKQQGDKFAQVLTRLGLPVQTATKLEQEPNEDQEKALLALRWISGRLKPDDQENLKNLSLDEKIESWDQAVNEELSSIVVDELSKLIFGKPSKNVAGLALIRSIAAKSDKAWELKQTAELVPKTRPIDDLLDWLILHSDGDKCDSRSNKISLMTLHAAKGLEWKVVIIAGCEDGLIPYARPGKHTDFEEERRLFFVGMTRAEQILVLSHVEERTLYGKKEQRTPCPFIEEIEEKYLKRDQGKAPSKRSAKPKKQQISLF